MTIPDELRYTAEHEWVAINGSLASVGITDFAQRSLGDVVYVSVPAPGTRVTAGEPCGEVVSLESFLSATTAAFSAPLTTNANAPSRTG